MAITVSTRPNEYSNSAIFVTTTDVAEDSTHVNTRIEAALYVDGVVIDKKVKPKGITTFDFTETLNSKCLFTTPALVDSSGTAIIDGGKTGSNLITGWTNDGFDTHTTSGANWTSLVTNNNAKSYTNTIAVTLGKIYVLIFKSTTCESIYTVQTKTTPANSNIVSSSADTRRMYIQPRTTGNIQLEFSVLSSGATYSYVGNWEMYEMNSNNWFCPYYVSFTEKYEDASGVTQTGATSTESVLNLFFKSNAATFTDYIITTNQKFLKSDGYNLSTNARSYNLLKIPPTSGRVSAYNLGVISKTLYQLKTRINRYDSSGALQTNTESSLQDIYSPIICVHIEQSLVATYPRADFSIMSEVAIDASEILRYDAVNTCYNSIVHLIWKNKTGGFDEYTFAYNITKGMVVEKEYYKDSGNKDKVIPSSIVSQRYITAFTPLAISELQLEYLKDLLESDIVYWQRGAGDMVMVTVKSDNIITKNDNEFTPFQIEITY
jgi:hypothetical protein